MQSSGILPTSDPIWRYCVPTAVGVNLPGPSRRVIEYERPRIPVICCLLTQISAARLCRSQDVCSGGVLEFPLCDALWLHMCDPEDLVTAQAWTSAS